MKSAYELALERLEKDQGPAKKLSDEQKAQISDIEKTYEAKIAETKLEFEARLAGAAPEDAASLREKLADTIASLEAKRDRDKDAVWNTE